APVTTRAPRRVLVAPRMIFVTFAPNGRKQSRTPCSSPAQPPVTDISEPPTISGRGRMAAAFTPTLRGVGDEDLVERLRKKDEDAFGVLVERYHLPMVRLTLTFVPNRSVAEEVVQDTW